MNKLLYFFVLTLAFCGQEIFAARRLAITTIKHKSGAYKQYPDCLIVQTPCYNIIFNKKNGEIVSLKYPKQIRDFAGGKRAVLGGDLFKSNNAVMSIINDSSRQLSVQFKKTSTSKLIIVKQYNLNAATPVINCTIKIHNDGPRQSLKYHLYFGAQPHAQPYIHFLYPRSKGIARFGVKRLPRSKDKSTLIKIKDFTSGWVAVMRNSQPKGLVVQTNTFEIETLSSNQQTPCIELYYKKCVLPKNGTFKTYFNLIPVVGLSWFQYASPNMLIQIAQSAKMQKININKSFNMNVLALQAERAVTFKVSLLRQDGSIVKKLGKRTIDLLIGKNKLSTGEVYSLFFPKQNIPSGDYGIKCVIERDGKITGQLVVPCVSGKSKKAFIIKKVKQAPLSSISKYNFSAGEYAKRRRKRKQERILLIKNWSSNTSYHVIEALRKRPETKLDIVNYFSMSWSYVKAKGYPGMEGLFNYDAVIFIDAPANMLFDQDIQNLQTFTAAGGMLIVYPGSMSAGAFHGSALENLLPVQVKDKDPKLNWKRSLWLSGWKSSPVKIKQINHPVLQGLSSLPLPESTFFPCKLKTGSEELLSINNQPLLAIRKNKFGNIVFFGIHPDRRELHDPFTTWDFYDELLNNLLDYGLKKQKILSIKKFTPPKGILIAPGKGKAVVLLKNNGSKTLSGELIYQLIGEKKQKTYNLNFSLKSKQQKTLTLAFNVPPLSAQYQFKMTVKNKGMDPQSIDCTVSAQPSSRLIPQILEHDFNGRSDMRKKRQRLTEWALGRGDVFTQGSLVPLSVKIVSAAKGKLRYELKITDFRGKLINKFPSKILSGSNSYSINNSWKSPLLTRGAYTVSGKLFKGDKLVDKFQEKLYYEHKADWEDFYPVNFSYLGYGGRDTVPVNKGIEEVKLLKKMGFNTIGYGYYTDEILKQGLNYSTISNHKVGIWFKNKNFRAPISQKKLKANMLRTYKYFKRRPRLALIQTDDETQMMKKDGEGKIDKALFKKEYGYSMPTDPKDKNWYHAVAFKAKGMADIMRKARKMTREYAPVEGMKKDRAICFPNTHYNLSHDPYAMFHDGPGSAHYVLAEKWIKIAPQVIDYTLAWTWAATDFSKTRLGIIMGLIADDGTEWKSGLGFWIALSYGAKFMEGYTWVSTHGYIPESKERVEVVSKTLGVMNKLGPAFLYLNKSRANVAMLSPWMTGRSLDNTKKLKWDLNYTMLRALFGQVDVLFDQQTKSELDKYQLLVIPSGAKSIHQDTQRNIVQWMKNSKGLLVISNDAAMQDQNRDPSDKLRKLINEPQYAKRVLTCNLIKVGAKEKVWEFAADKVDLIATSSNPQVICDLHSPASKAAWVITTVNMSREEQSTLLKVKLPKKKYSFRDMLTGKKIKAKLDKDIYSIALSLPGVWGRVIVASEHFPQTLNLQVKDCARNGILQYTINAKDKQGKLINWPLVCSITVIDPAGNKRIEYGGRHVTKGGIYSKKITVPSNEITGVWTIKVSEAISGKSVSATYKIE